MKNRISLSTIYRIRLEKVMDTYNRSYSIRDWAIRLVLILYDAFAVNASFFSTKEYRIRKKMQYLP